VENTPEFCEPETLLFLTLSLARFANRFSPSLYSWADTPMKNEAA
jgi:hypothetical protein